ncbi:MAG TPA: hypothetical protein PKK85_08400 [Methanobacteriaceae archaeon]|nr:hypothetical protein [Methanobacteriaceae archaeon]
MVKDSFKFDNEKNQLLIDGEHMELVITFKSDRYREIVSKTRRLAMEYDIKELFRRVSYENPEFRDGLNNMFGVLLMADLPSSEWKKQTDYLLK